MSDISRDATPLEKVIHQAFHDIADKYNLDADLVAEIISEYDDIMSKRIRGVVFFFSLN